MTRTITNFAFLVAICIVVLIFFSSRTYPQIAFAVILYSALVYIGFMIFPRRVRRFHEAIHTPNTEPKVDKAVIKNSEPASKSLESATILDIDRRVFLKLIGATSISFFIFSVLGRSVESLIFGKNSLSGLAPGNNSFSPPAPASPTDGYKISEIDESETSFFGFTNQNGAWLIMKEDAYANSFRYAKGENDFPKNWESRENLNYDYFHNIFGK